ncbi:MAG TPA: chemotaxis protein CheC, partial [Myxococcales bacterium]|nr:chemotaxis protein CheC [Myxococcales bacterium]
PSPLQLDALREVANVGCGNAASALSRLVGGRRVSIEVPRALVVDVDDLSDLVGGHERQVVAATLDIQGQMAGRVMVVLERMAAHRLCELLLNESTGDRLREPQRSAFSEAANIVASACLSAIGQLTGLQLVPSVPTVDEDDADSVVQELLHRSDPGAGVAVVLETRFAASAAPFEGQLLVVPHPASLRRLLERLGV